MRTFVKLFVAMLLTVGLVTGTAVSALAIWIGGG